MFYAFHHDVQATELIDAPKILDMGLCGGLIHQVDIMFEDGCNYDVGVQIFQGGSQIWPSQPGQSFRGNATIVSFREFFELSKQNDQLRAVIWTDDAANYGMVVIQFGVLPPEIVQPLSFKSLLDAAAGL